MEGVSGRKLCLASLREYLSIRQNLRRNDLVRAKRLARVDKLSKDFARLHALACDSIVSQSPRIGYLQRWCAGMM